MLSLMNICMLALFFIHTARSIAASSDNKIQWTIINDVDQESVGRQKRALRAFTLLWAPLLRGAELITLNNRLKLYLKVGSMDDAIHDFYSLNPTDISTTHSGELFGRVGESIIYLRGRDPDSSERFQALLIVMGKDDAKDFGLHNSPFRRTRGIKYVSDPDHSKTWLWKGQLGKWMQ